MPLPNISSKSTGRGLNLRDIARFRHLELFSHKVVEGFITGALLEPPRYDEALLQKAGEGAYEGWTILVPASQKSEVILTYQSLEHIPSSCNQALGLPSRNTESI